MMAWMKQHGTQFHDNARLNLVDPPPGYPAGAVWRGIFAADGDLDMEEARATNATTDWRAGIEKGALIMMVPVAIMLTTGAETLDRSDLKGPLAEVRAGPHRLTLDDHTTLAVLVMREWARGGASFWAPYLRSLPSVRDAGASVGLHPGSVEARVLQRAGGAWSAVAAQQAMWRRAFARLDALLFRPYAHLFTPEHAGCSSIVVAAGTAGAVGAAATGTGAELEAAGICEAARLKLISSRYEEAAFAVASRAFGPLLGHGGPNCLLIPGADLLNHRTGANGPGRIVHTPLPGPAPALAEEIAEDVPQPFVGIQAAWDIKAGEEAFGQYNAHHCNERLLMIYGFVEPGGGGGVVVGGGGGNESAAAAAVSGGAGFRDCLTLDLRFGARDIRVGGAPPAAQPRGGGGAGAGPGPWEEVGMADDDGAMAPEHTEAIRSLAAPVRGNANPHCHQFDHSRRDDARLLFPLHHPRVYRSRDAAPFECLLASLAIWWRQAHCAAVPAVPAASASATSRGRCDGGDGEDEAAVARITVAVRWFGQLASRRQRPEQPGGSSGGAGGGSGVASAGALRRPTLLASLEVVRQLQRLLQRAEEATGLHRAVNVHAGASVVQRNVFEVLAGARRVWASVRDWAGATEAELVAALAVAPPVTQDHSRVSSPLGEALEAERR
jgi:hypothetical protein